MQGQACHAGMAMQGQASSQSIEQFASQMSAGGSRGSMMNVELTCLREQNATLEMQLRQQAQGMADTRDLYDKEHARLQSIISDLKTQLQTQKDDSSRSLRDMQQGFMQQLLYYQKQVCSLDKEVEEKEAALCAAQQQILELESVPQVSEGAALEQLAEMQQMLLAAQQELESSEAELTTVRQQGAELHAELASVQQELMSTKAELTAGEHQVAELQRQLASDHKKLLAAQQELGANKAAASAAQEQVTGLQKELVSAQQGLESTKAELTAAQQQTAAVEKESATVQRELVETRQQNSTLQAKLDAAQQKVVTLQKELVLVRQEQAAARLHTQAAKHQVQEQVRMQEELHAAQQQLQERDAALAAAQEEVRVRRQQSQRGQTLISEAQHALEQWAAREQALQAELQDIRAQLAAEQQACAQQSDALITAQGTVQELWRRNAQLESANMLQRQELDAARAAQQLAAVEVASAKAWSSELQHMASTRMELTKRQDGLTKAHDAVEEWSPPAESEITQDEPIAQHTELQPQLQATAEQVQGTMAGWQQQMVVCSRLEADHQAGDSPTQELLVPDHSPGEEGHAVSAVEQQRGRAHGLVLKQEDQEGALGMEEQEESLLASVLVHSVGVKHKGSTDPTDVGQGMRAGGYANASPSRDCSDAKVQQQQQHRYSRRRSRSPVHGKAHDAPPAVHKVAWSGNRSSHSPDCRRDAGVLSPAVQGHERSRSRSRSQERRVRPAVARCETVHYSPGEVTEQVASNQSHVTHAAAGKHVLGSNEALAACGTGMQQHAADTKPHATSPVEHGSHAGSLSADLGGTGNVRVHPGAAGSLRADVGTTGSEQGSACDEHAATCHAGQCSTAKVGHVRQAAPAGSAQVALQNTAKLPQVLSTGRHGQADSDMRVESGANSQTCIEEEEMDWDSCDGPPPVTEAGGLPHTSPHTPHLFVHLSPQLSPHNSAPPPPPPPPSPPHPGATSPPPPLSSALAPPEPQPTPLHAPEQATPSQLSIHEMAMAVFPGDIPFNNLRRWLVQELWQAGERAVSVEQLRNWARQHPDIDPIASQLEQVLPQPLLLVAEDCPCFTVCKQQACPATISFSLQSLQQMHRDGHPAGRIALDAHHSLLQQLTHTASVTPGLVPTHTAAPASHSAAPPQPLAGNSAPMPLPERMAPAFTGFTPSAVAQHAGFVPLPPVQHTLAQHAPTQHAGFVPPPPVQQAVQPGHWPPAPSFQHVPGRPAMRAPEPWQPPAHAAPHSQAWDGWYTPPPPAGRYGYNIPRR